MVVAKTAMGGGPNDGFLPGDAHDTYIEQAAHTGPQETGKNVIQPVRYCCHRPVMLAQDVTGGHREKPDLDRNTSRELRVGGYHSPIEVYMPKPPRPDSEYFGKLDAQKMRQLAEEKRSRLAKDELDKLKELHWRRCSECGWELETIVFKGTTIHKCFNCGGVFLEEGAMEKLCGKESHFLEAIVDLFRC